MRMMEREARFHTKVERSGEHHEHGAERNANDGARSAFSHESGEKWRAS